MTTKNTPAHFHILCENLSNEWCGVFHLQLKLLFIFSLKLLMLSILVSQISLVNSHERILVFSMKVIPILVFKIFCPICAPFIYLKCIAREKKCPCLMCQNNGCLSSQYICGRCISIPPTPFLLCFWVLWLQENDSRSFRSLSYYKNVRK